MFGITQYGIYLPSKRLKWEEIDRAVGKPGHGSGEKAVANFDEDALTLAVNALYQSQIPEQKGVNALFWAGTTSPYLEKSAAALAAETLPFGPPDFTADFSGSLRAASNALLLSQSFVGGAPKSVALAASDLRQAAPYSDEERSLGDGAVALLLANTAAPVAALVASASTSLEILDTWRKSGDRFLKMTEPHFRLRFGFGDTVARLYGQFQKSTGIALEKIDHFALNAPNEKLLLSTLKRVGRKPAPLTIRLYREIGFTGTSFGLLNFLAELESAAVGETILWIDYADGANALLFRKETAIVEPQLARAIDLKIYLNSYHDYLRLRNLLKTENPPVEPFTSAVMNFREKRQNYALLAQKCQNCGEVVYPHVRICKRCGSKDQFELVPISREGTIFTFTKEYLYPSPEGLAVTASADMDSGVRLFLQVTDTNYEQVAVGQRVRRTFRRLHSAGGFHNYFWKFRVVPG